MYAIRSWHITSSESAVLPYRTNVYASVRSSILPSTALNYELRNGENNE